MKFFKNKLAVTVVVLSVTFLGLIIFTSTKEYSGLESGAGSALNPLQKIVYNVNRATKDFVDFFLNFSSVKEEIKDLKKENEELKEQLSQNSDLEEQNQRLKTILDFQETRDQYDYISTNIIHYAGAGVVDGYVVDKGSKDGVEVGMVVIASEGLVGRVSKVGSNWAIIQCIINENIKVSVMPESTRENSGILEGYTDRNKNMYTKIQYLPMDSEVKEGDVILTSGLGLVYPKEIRVGEVLSVEEDKVKVMKSAIVKPFVNFEKLEELFIIVPKDKRVIEYDDEVK